MTQRIASLQLKALIDEAMRQTRRDVVHERAIERLDKWLGIHRAEACSTYVRYDIGPTRRRWLDAHIGGLNGPQGPEPIPEDV